jgi:transposase InsO family protein
VKFAFIHAERAKLPVTRLCAALDVSPSGYYAWAQRPPSQRAVADAKLVPVIRACHVRSRGTYGSPRIHKDLQALGHQVSRKRVARLMRREGVSARPPRHYRATTESKHPLPVAPNVVARNFQTDGPNRVWVTDMTPTCGRGRDGSSSPRSSTSSLAGSSDGPWPTICAPSSLSTRWAWLSAFDSPTKDWSIILTVAVSTRAKPTAPNWLPGGSSAA